MRHRSSRLRRRATAPLTAVNGSQPRDSHLRTVGCGPASIEYAAIGRGRGSARSATRGRRPSSAPPDSAPTNRPRQMKISNRVMIQTQSLGSDTPIRLKTCSVAKTAKKARQFGRDGRKCDAMEPRLAGVPHAPDRLSRRAAFTRALRRRRLNRRPFDGSAGTLATIVQRKECGNARASGSCSRGR